MRRSRAFTIIELLVVICVICILVAIVIPAVNKIRQSTSQLTCLSNMRTIAQASIQYAADNSGQTPYNSWAGGGPGDGSTYQFNWLYVGVTYRSRYPLVNWSGPNYPTNGPMSGMLWPYINTLSVYHCPMDLIEFDAGTEFMTSYLCNGAQCGYGAVGNTGNGMQNVPGAMLRKFTKPAYAVWYWEAMEQRYENQSLTGAVWNDASSYPTEEVLADRHFKGANVACFDGHVEWWDPNTWAVNVNTGGYSRLWCSPYSSSGH